MNVVGIILCLLLVGFIGYQIYGLIRDVLKRRKLKNSSDISNINKEDK